MRTRAHWSLARIQLVSRIAQIIAPRLTYYLPQWNNSCTVHSEGHWRRGFACPFEVMRFQSSVQRKKICHSFCNSAAENLEFLCSLFYVCSATENEFVLMRSAVSNSFIDIGKRHHYQSAVSVSNGNQIEINWSRNTSHIFNYSAPNLSIPAWRCKRKAGGENKNLIGINTRRL